MESSPRPRPAPRIPRDDERWTTSLSRNRDRPLGESVRSLRLAERYIKQRLARSDVFGVDAFREPAWEIMLDLYCAQARGNRVSIMDACIAAQVPSTTGFRYVDRLLNARLVIRRPDDDDRRRSWLLLTEEAVNKIERWLNETWPEVDD